MDFSSAFDHVSKEKFSHAANKLLGDCFLLKKHKDTTSEYNYILNNREAFSEFFGIIGYELIIDEQNGVIGLNNPSGTGRIHLKKLESVLLLILRLLYIEKRKQLSQVSEVIIVADEIYDKYNLLKLGVRIDRTAMKNALGMFQRYHLISKLDYDMSNPETRIEIHPSIMLAVTSNSLDALYDTAQERLCKYAIGGDLLDAANENIEETDED